MSRWLLFLLILGPLAGVGPVRAGAAADGPGGLTSLQPGERVTASAALDGATLRLDDGRVLRLAGIDTPQAELPRTDAAAAPRRRAASSVEDLAEAARTALNDLTQGRDVALYYEERRNDRYGRVVAHAVIGADLWIETELLRRGLARVHTTFDTAAAAAPLLAAEAQARAARRGLWANAAYQVRRASDIGRWVDSFQLVEGRIASVRRGASQTVLAFADAGPRPVSIVIPSTARRNFRAAGTDPAELAEHTVRLRGWVRWQSGPVIDLDHPAQVEILN